MVTSFVKNTLLSRWRRTTIGVVILLILGASSPLANTAAGWLLVVLPAVLIYKGERDKHRYEPYKLLESKDKNPSHQPGFDSFFGSPTAE